MLLSELLGASVRAEGAVVGHVIDVRLVANEAPAEGSMPQLRIHGLVVSPHARGSTLGYERSGVRSPWPVAALQRWIHRGSFLVRWPDVQAIHGRDVELRPEHRRYAAVLRANLTRGPGPEEHQH